MERREFIISLITAFPFLGILVKIFRKRNPSIPPTNCHSFAFPIINAPFPKLDLVEICKVQPLDLRVLIGEEEW